MEARITHREGEVLHGIKAQDGQRFFSFKVTLTASPLAITFAGQSLPNMKDTAYRVAIHSEGNVGNLDESTIATTGFSILGGTGAEIAHVWVHGNVEE